MSKLQRKASFRRDILHCIHTTPGGSFRYQNDIRSFALNFVNDLSKLNALPARLKNLKSEHLYALVSYWKHKDLSLRTIQNRISILRKLFVASGIMDVPSNAALQIKYKSAIVKKFRNKEILPDSIKNPIIRDLCQIQYYFGLKKREALLLDSSMMIGDRLEMSRSVSYNKIDRRIPILTEQQRQLIEYFKEEYSGRFVSNKYEYIALSAGHMGILQELGISDKEYFRYCYIANRFHALKHQFSSNTALKTLRTECGYVRNNQLKEILREKDFNSMPS